MNTIINIANRAWRKFLRFFPKHIEFSLGELMLQRKEVSHGQFAISALVMDVENYCLRGDASFYWQNVGRRIRLGNNYDSSSSNSRFREVIDSVMRNGYREDSLLEVGTDVMLHNGTHRTAICLFNKHYQVKGNAYCYQSPFFKPTASEFIDEMGFDREYVEAVMRKYNAIQEGLLDDGISYCCFSDNEQIMTELTKDDSVHVKRIHSVKADKYSVGGG